MLHTLMLLLQAVTVGSIFYALLTVLLPYAAGFIAAEWAKAWAWVQRLGGILGSIVGAAAAAAMAFGFSWLVAHVPGIEQYIPADLHTLSAEQIIGLLTGVLNAIFHVPPAMKAARLERKLKF